MWLMNRPVFNGPEKNSHIVQAQTKRKIRTHVPHEAEPRGHLVVSHRRQTDHSVFGLSGQKTV